MDKGLRRNDRNDNVVQMLSQDPIVVEALGERTQSQRKRMRESVEAALSENGRKLKGWVAVAVWEHEDGSSTQTVMSDDHSSVLEIKGMLHDAVWSAAHADAE